MKKLVLLPLIVFLAADFSELSVIKVESDCVTPEATTYEISSDDKDFILPETSSQKVISQKVSGNTKTITIRTGINESFEKIPDVSMTKTSKLMKLSDPSVTEAAKPLFDMQNPPLAAEALVYDIIEEKTIGISMLNARDILKGKTGDCSEHAVLSAALIRKLKIPVIGVVGLVFSEKFGRQKNVFVYHMWCEAYYGGRWIIIDATRPNAKYPNRYIAIGYHDLTSDVPLDLVGRLQQIKNLKISAHR